MRIKNRLFINTHQTSVVKHLRTRLLVVLSVLIVLLLLLSVASVLLVVYGGLNVLAGALVLLDVIHPGGRVDQTALRWHVGVWDLWFLLWGILLALAAFGYWRRTANHSAA